MTGLTSNPTIFDHAIKNSTAYDAAIREKLAEGKSGEALFFELALEDITRAADLFRPIHDETNGVDGWVSLEVSPLLAHDTASTLAAAKDLHARAGRPNLFIKIPGTKEGLPAIEEAIFAGMPINVTLLFSREHYVAAAEAFLRGIERRIDAGLEPRASAPSPRCSSAAGTPRSRTRCPRLSATGSASPSRSARTRLPRAAQLTALAARLQRRSPPAASALGQHGNQGPQGLRYPLRQGSGRSLHGEHDAGRHVESPRRSRRIGAPAGRRWTIAKTCLAQFAKAGIDVDALAAQLQDEEKSMRPMRALQPMTGGDVAQSRIDAIRIALFCLTLPLVAPPPAALCKTPPKHTSTLGTAKTQVPARLEPGEYLWHPEISPQGPIVMVVSLPEQRAYVYRNGVLIGASTVSTGKKGHETPTGVFTILQKHEDHYSNLYNDAPMPYMQRLTWSGVALHAGRLPGYPASHGCVRMPYEFAHLLFGETKTGHDGRRLRREAVPQHRRAPWSRRAGGCDDGCTGGRVCRRRETSSGNPRQRPKVRSRSW